MEKRAVRVPELADWRQLESVDVKIAISQLPRILELDRTDVIGQFDSALVSGERTISALSETDGESRGPPADPAEGPAVDHWRPESPRQWHP
jgi:hypothetical protein